MRSKDSNSRSMGGRLRLAPVEKDWRPIAGLSLLGGALLCFALLDVTDYVAVLAGGLAAALLYAVISALWDPGAREGAISLGVSDRRLRALTAALGALLLTFSFLGAVKTDSGSRPLLSVGWTGLALALGALGALLLSATSMPLQRICGSTVELNSSVFILEGSLLAYLVLSAGVILYPSSSLTLQNARDWFLLVAFASGLVFTVACAVRDSRREASG